MRDILFKKSLGESGFDPALLKIDWSEGDRAVRFSGSVDRFVESIETAEESGLPR